VFCADIFNTRTVAVVVVDDDDDNDDEMMMMMFSIYNIKSSRR
jgi:DNA-binding transcriptional regulator of glucitol operon